MSLTFFLESEGNPPPANSPIRFYVDSTSGSLREGLDIELSHWNPNITPERFQADSSTEIALNYLVFGVLPEEGLVVNNHLDVDGVLAAWVLLQPEVALRHRETLVGAAEIGDFWACAPEPSQALYQGLVEILNAGAAAGKESLLIHESCFAAIPGMLEAGAANLRLKQIPAARKLVADGLVTRTLHHHRFASWCISRAAHGGDVARALHISAFNASLEDGSLVHPVLRNQLDGKRVQLVSVETEGGWHHDLHYPGYMWALTVDRWRAPGMWEGDSSNAWYFRYAPLEEALARLNKLDEGQGTWQSAEELTPFASVLGRAFPVVASFMGDDDTPALSSLDPDTVARELRQAFTYDLTGLNR